MLHTDLIQLPFNKVRSASVGRVCEALEAGGVVALPTDTVYGLAAHIFRPRALRRIYTLKGRHYRKPLPLLVAHLDQARALVEPLVPRLERLLKDYWPGPLTVVFATSSLGRWVTGGKTTVAIRIPKHPVMLSVLKALGTPLAVTSANRSHHPPASRQAEVVSLFQGKVDVLWAGGDCPLGIASTVLDASSHHWTLRRAGAVPKEALMKYLV